MTTKEHKEPKIGVERSVYAAFDVIRELKDPVAKATRFTETLQILSSRGVLTKAKFEELMEKCYALIKGAEADDAEKASELWTRTALILHEVDQRVLQHKMMQQEMQETVEPPQQPRKVMPVSAMPPRAMR